jgi:hypothetical protein
MGLAKGFGSSFGKVVLPAAKEDQSRNLRLPHPRHATMATGERLAGESLRLLRTPNPSFNLDHGALGRRQVGLKKGCEAAVSGGARKPRCDAEGVALVALAANWRDSRRSFSSEHKLKLNGSSISLKYYGPVHTDGDISVTFGEADILHAADTYWNGIYPFIDYSTGGGIDGMIAASDANLAATKDKTIIIPGHGKPVSWSQSGRTLPRSKSKDDRETRRSRQRRPLPLMLSGATSSSTPRLLHQVSL